MNQNYLNLENQYNLFDAYGPGIYQICCEKTKKRYIGEAENILDRLGKHPRELQKNISHCYSLQKDWN